MVCVAVEDDLAERLAEDRGDDPERLAGALEHGPLLDVQLEVGARQAAGGDAGPAARATALLVPEGDDGQRRSRAFGGLDRGDDPERTVEAAAVRDRVEVRARPDLCGAPAAEGVARAVDLDLEPGLHEPARDEPVGRVLLRRAADAGRADRVELVEPFDHPAHAPILAVNPACRAAGASRRAGRGR